jgi:hypothetical protein
MKKGSNGLGGTRYQIAAVVLTYLAISASAVPVMVNAVNKRVEERNVQLAQQSQSEGQSPEQAQHVQINWNRLAGTLALWAAASPFLELQSSPGAMIGLVILFVGLSIAFRMTAARPLAVDGPYAVTAG